MAVLRYEVDEGVATVTLDRPESRNALSSELLGALAKAMKDAGGDDAVRVVVLTGTDPAFCAGLDLKELGSAVANFGSLADFSSPWQPISKPVIGAVNGVAVTGGLEIALRCDFLVASEQAKFGDTHARVGIMPGWGLSVLLPQKIGLARSIEMSLTGNFVGAAEALSLGLVNHVVPHRDLLPTVRALAVEIVGNDPVVTRDLLSSYRRIADETGVADGFRLEREARAGRERFDHAEVARRRDGIMDRGRKQ